MTNAEKMELLKAGHPAPWAEYESDQDTLEKISEDFDYRLSSRVRAAFAKAFDTDGDGDKEFRSLVEMYKNASKEYRMVIDAVLVNLCGWSLPTLIEQAKIEK